MQLILLGQLPGMGWAIIVREVLGDVAMASIFRRGKSKNWWIKYYANGRQVYYSLRTNDIRVAKRIKRQIEGEEAKGELLAPSKTLLPAFLEDFGKFLSTIRTQKSYSSDISVLRVFFGPVCPALELGSYVNKRWRSSHSKRLKDTMRHIHVKAEFLEEITTTRIESFLARRILEDGIAPKTANRYRGVLHRMFNFAIKNWQFVSVDRRHANPAAMVERRREPARTIRFLSILQIQQQLKVLQVKATLHGIVATLIYAGLRRSEALWLTVDDVDLERKLIYVQAKTVNEEYWQPKTKHNRTVPISSTLHKILTEYRPERQAPWFFPSTIGKRWDPDNFSRDLRKINREHGSSWSCLHFRHTFGSHLAQKGVSLYKIAKLMGNSPDICRKHYAALMPEKMHDVVEFETSTSSGDRSTKEMFKQILDKLEPKASTETIPKLRIVKS